MKKTLTTLASGLVLMGMTGMAQASLVSWVDWEITAIGLNGSANGTITQNGATIIVNYSGQAQWETPSYYWDENIPEPYTGNPVVDNAPTSGIALTEVNTSISGYANRLDFSQPVTGLLFALYSVGNSSVPVSYAFDQSFTFLSEGFGYWGDGTFDFSGNTITGREGHGVIQFTGPISSLSWNNPNPEYHHGFAVGAVSAVPIPGAVWLLGSGLAGLGLFRRRKTSRV
jgi:hypothetical protein